MVGRGQRLLRLQPRVALRRRPAGRRHLRRLPPLPRRRAGCGRRVHPARLQRRLPALPGTPPPAGAVPMSESVTREAVLAAEAGPALDGLVDDLVLGIDRTASTPGGRSLAVRWVTECVADCAAGGVEVA